MEAKVALGKKFGRLTVVRELEEKFEPNGHKRRIFLVRCDCGFEYALSSVQFVRTKHPTMCKTCSREARRSVAIGQRFDRLIVVELDRSSSRLMAVCRCDCGNTVRVRSSNLPKNETNNCGCAVRGNWRGHGDLSLTYFGQLKRNAKARDISFDVSIEQLWELFVKQNGKCALTGINLNLTKKRSDPNTTASVDRIDSSKPYVVGNVQWVHKDINLMKQDLDQERFLSLCRDVTAYDDALRSLGQLRT